MIKEAKKTPKDVKVKRIMPRKKRKQPLYRLVPRGRNEFDIYQRIRGHYKFLGRYIKKPIKIPITEPTPIVEKKGELKEKFIIVVNYLKSFETESEKCGHTVYIKVNAELRETLSIHATAKEIQNTHFTFMDLIRKKLNGMPISDSYFGQNTYISNIRTLKNGWLKVKTSDGFNKTYDLP